MAEPHALSIAAVEERQHTHTKNVALPRTEKNSLTSQAFHFHFTRLGPTYSCIYQLKQTNPTAEDSRGAPQFLNQMTNTLHLAQQTDERPPKLPDERREGDRDHRQKMADSSKLVETSSQ